MSSATGAVRYRIPGGVPSADGNTVMGLQGDRLIVSDAHTGMIRRTVPVGPGLVISIVAPDGQAAALTTSPTDTYRSAGRTQTRLAVVKLPDATVTRFNLPGNLVPDAFANDGRDLFLVNYLPAEAPTRYQITTLDLIAGTVGSVFGREKEALEDMRGLAGMRAFAPDHATLYTLYLRPTTQPSDSTRAEIHALKLDARWAHCVDLPDGFGADLHTTAVAVAPDGKRLYAVDRAARRLVEVDTDALTVTRTVAIPFSATTSVPPSLAVAGNGRLYVTDGPTIISLRTDSLAVVGRRQARGPVNALVVAGDGHGLFASSPRHVEAFDAVTGPTSSTPIPDDAVTISHILT